MCSGIGAQFGPEPQTPQAKLSFAGAVHQFNTGDRDHCVAELPEPLHHSNALLEACRALTLSVFEMGRRAQYRDHFLFIRGQDTKL